MAEYIEREVAINAALMGDIDKDFPRMDIAARLHDIPAADVVERKKGKWVKISPAGIRECSLCHQSILTSDIDVYKFCFSCGAKMEES